MQYGWRLTLHDFVAVGDQTEGNDKSENRKLPDGDGSLSSGSVASRPGGVDDGPGTDGVADVVSTVGEGSSAGSKNLDERV